MIFGLIQESGDRRIRKNRELRTLYEDTEIIGLVKSKSLRWEGHLQRRGEQRIKRFWTERPNCTRPLERPRVRWTDQVLGDLIPN